MFFTYCHPRQCLESHGNSYSVFVCIFVVVELSKIVCCLHHSFGTQKGKNADCVDMIKKTVYTLCVTVLS
jgi:hypothetical protein